MKNLFENWQKYLEEDEAQKNDSPKVVCYCECEDCIFNVSLKCVDPINTSGEKGAIDLKWSKNEYGERICECETYQITEGDMSGRGEGSISES